MNNESIYKKKKMNRVVKQAVMLIIVIVLLIATIVAIIHVNKKKHTAQVSSDEYGTSQNELDEENSLIVDITENEIDEQKQNNEINENSQSNTTDNNQLNSKSNNSQGTKYKLEVNCTANVVNVYEKDENGDYTKCVKVMLCSVGSATPHSGTYSLKKYGGASWRWRPLFGNVYGQYATQITGNILFHSVPYTKPNNSNLEYWEYDKLGTSASMGCVRLTVQNAKWIWDNCASGTKVRFYDDSNPGPLGKPTEAKISWNEECRSWDPTDPDANNPWRNNNKKPETNKPNEDNNKPEENKTGGNELTGDENKPVENNPSQDNNLQEGKPTGDNNKTEENKPVKDENKTGESMKPSKDENKSLENNTNK